MVLSYLCGWVFFQSGTGTIFHFSKSQSIFVNFWQNNFPEWTWLRVRFMTICLRINLLYWCTSIIYEYLLLAFSPLLETECIPMSLNSDRFHGIHAIHFTFRTLYRWWSVLFSSFYFLRLCAIYSIMLGSVMVSPLCRTLIPTMQFLSRHHHYRIRTPATST